MDHIWLDIWLYGPYDHIWSYVVHIWSYMIHTWSHMWFIYDHTWSKYNHTCSIYDHVWTLYDHIWSIFENMWYIYDRLCSIWSFTLQSPVPAPTQGRRIPEISGYALRTCLSLLWFWLKSNDSLGLPRYFLYLLLCHCIWYSVAIAYDIPSDWTFQSPIPAAPTGGGEVGLGAGTYVVQIWSHGQDMPIITIWSTYNHMQHVRATCPSAAACTMSVSSCMRRIRA